MSGRTRPRIIDNDSDSDSDDNVPLAQLKKASAPSLKQEPATNGGAVKRETPADSDSDDNAPISSLAQRTKRVKVEPSARPAAVSTTTAAATTKPPPTRASPRTPAAKKKRMKIKFKQQECTEELYQTLKGRLVQELLCRWWYAVEWPSASAKPAAHLHGVQELDGFRGAFIRVRGEDMGSIVDTRPSVGKPSFMHFFALPSADVQRLLVKAYEKQMEALREHEGPDVPLLKELKSALTSAMKISPEKADKSVTKVLKKYKELADQIKEIQEKAMQEENTGTEEEEELGDENDDSDEEDTGSFETGGGDEDDDDDEDDDENNNDDDDDAENGGDD